MPSTVPFPSSSPLVKKVIDWVEELLQHQEILEGKENSLDACLEWLVQNKKHFQKRDSQPPVDKEDVNDDLKDEEDDVTGITNLESAAMKLIAAAILCHLGNLERAKEILYFLEKLENVNVPSKTRGIIERLRDSLKQDLGLLDVAEKHLPLILESPQLTPNLEAMLLFIKSFTGILMGIPGELVLELQQKAIDKDPECHALYHYAYRTARHIRRNSKRILNKLLYNPSEQEENFAKEGYSRAPGDIYAITDYAMMLKEKLWTHKESYWKEHMDDYETCVKLSR